MGYSAANSAAKKRRAVSVQAPHLPQQTNIRNHENTASEAVNHTPASLLKLHDYKIFCLEQKLNGTNKSDSELLENNKLINRLNAVDDNIHDLANRKSIIEETIKEILENNVVLKANYSIWVNQMEELVQENENKSTEINALREELANLKINNEHISQEVKSSNVGTINNDYIPEPCPLFDGTKDDATKDDATKDDATKDQLTEESTPVSELAYNSRNKNNKKGKVTLKIDEK